jgi:dATP pyrophosphohydrolase
MEKPDKIINRVLYGVDVPIFNIEGKVLMLRRDSKEDTYKTGWEYVKGGIKENESFVEAAFREASEEAGPNLDLKLIGEIDKELKVDVRNRNKPLYDYVLLKGVVLLYQDGQIVTDNKEHSDYKWMDFNEAKEIIWVDYGKKVLDEAKALFDKWKS